YERRDRLYDRGVCGFEEDPVHALLKNVESELRLVDVLYGRNDPVRLRDQVFERDDRPVARRDDDDPVLPFLRRLVLACLVGDRALDHVFAGNEIAIRCDGGDPPEPFDIPGPVSHDRIRTALDGGRHDLLVPRPGIHPELLHLLLLQRFLRVDVVVDDAADGLDKRPGVVALEGVPSHADPGTAGRDRFADHLEGFKVAALLATGNKDRHRAGFGDPGKCLGASRVTGLYHVSAELFSHPDALPDGLRRGGVDALAP